MGPTVIIDYRLCNLDSIHRAIEVLGGKPLVTRDPAALSGAARIILPGVGAFASAMANLKNDGMVEAIQNELARRPIPFLGICLGMQLLAERSDEGGEVAGLGLIPGHVALLKPNQASERVPHMGWNEVHSRRPHPLLSGIEDGSDFYFVHSYHFICAAENRLAETPYCGAISSIVTKRNILGVQFHPEKSQKAGFKLLENFLNLQESH